MNVKNLFRESAGFALIQILVTVGLVGGLLVVGIQQQDIFRKNKMTSDFNTEVVRATEYLSTVLSDPYVCSATVSGVTVGQFAIGSRLAYPGGPRIGTEHPISNGPISAIRNAEMNTSTLPGALFWRPAGLPHAKVNTEMRPGVRIVGIHLLNNGIQDLIRVKFAPRNLIGKSGAQIINKDFLLTSTRSGATIRECNINVLDGDLRAACENVYGTWDQGTKKCIMADLVDTRTDLLEVWRLSNGTVTTVAPLTSSTIVGSVSCQCSSLKCERAPRPCRCALPSCTTICPTCKPGAADNWDRCQARVLGVCTDRACQYRKQCGRPPPATGFLITPRL